MDALVKRTLVGACVLFTIFMVFGSLAAMGFVGPQYGLVMTLTLMLAAIALSVLQAVWFTDRLIGRLSYPLRILGYGATAFVALLGCAWLGNWFPLDDGGAWVTFTLIYFIVLAAFCIGYQIYFKRTVGSFDEALRHYHERMGR